MAIKITCIKKDDGFHENPYIAISELGWVSDVDNAAGNSTRVQIYDWLQAGGVAYIVDLNGQKNRLMGNVSPKGTKYLKTHESEENDILLALSECK